MRDNNITSPALDLILSINFRHLSNRVLLHLALLRPSAEYHSSLHPCASDNQSHLDVQLMNATFRAHQIITFA
jgi:hypothetical protein